MDGGGSAWVRASDSEMVGAPLLDGFLDFFGRKLFVESSGGEGREFVVGGEAEGDQLGFGEFGDAGTESGVEQGGKTEALFDREDAERARQRALLDWLEPQRSAFCEDLAPAKRSARRRDG